MIFKEIANYNFDTVSKGKAKNVDEFIEKIVKNQFEESKDTIIEIHKTLMKYVEQASSTYFLRLYGAFTKDKYDLLRRGFLSEYACGNKMVFCDNTFSMLFTGAKLSNKAYTVEDLNKLFSGKELICSFGVTTKERELIFYDNKNAPKVDLNSRGWYLAHLNPVGKSYSSLKEKSKLKEVFINPDRKEWNSDSKVRQVKSSIPASELELLKAHFLRLVHPLNSFLVPKRTQLLYEGKNFGEEDELLYKVQNLVKNMFPVEYGEFCKLAMVSELERGEKSDIAEIEWKNGKYEKSKKIVEKSVKLLTKQNTKNIDMVIEDIDNISDGRNEVLEDNLKSVGLRTFTFFMFEVFTENKNASIEDVELKYGEKYSQENGKVFKGSSKKTHISVSKRIFENGLEYEALKIIRDSKANADVKEKANKLLGRL
ncbi:MULTISPECIES: hypothetical protein [unclassified Myroides]|uniref:hypothetical protein n=1 Tax=unclassified Myroides TaxID=2642485 RepID=UPI003100D0B8